MASKISLLKCIKDDATLILTEKEKLQSEVLGLDQTEGNVESPKCLGCRCDNSSEDAAEGCCSPASCALQPTFGVGDVLCLAVGFMLLLMILAQAYKIVIDREHAPRRRRRC